MLNMVIDILCLRILKPNPSDPGVHQCKLPSVTLQSILTMAVNDHHLTCTQSLFYKYYKCLLDLQKYKIAKFLAKNVFIYNKISF